MIPEDPYVYDLDRTMDSLEIYREEQMIPFEGVRVPLLEKEEGWKDRARKRCKDTCKGYASGVIAVVVIGIISVLGVVWYRRTNSRL